MSKNILFLRRIICISILVLACSPLLRAQNVRIGTEDQGSSYAIEAGLSNRTMTFTEDGATATASNDSIWNGRIIMDDSGTISVSSASVLTVGGGVRGSGHLSKSGAGTMLLNSTSSQTGATIVEAGTLQAGKDKVFSAQSQFTLTGGTVDLNDTTQEIASLGGNGTVKFGSSGTGNLTAGRNNIDSTFSGTFSGQGTLVKTGTGTMLLTGSNTSGATIFDVQKGTLDINGDFSVADSSATVRKRAALGGSGSLYNVVVEAGGTLAPGNRTGYEVLATDTLTVENDLTLASESSLSIRVDDAGNSDRVVVSGIFTNTDGGATLEIDALAGKYDTAETYDTFLVDGSGTNIADFTAENISLRQQFLELSVVTETPNSFQLTRISNYFTDRAQTPNQRQVATVLDQTDNSKLWRAMTNIANSTNQIAVAKAYDEMAASVKANSLALGQWQTSRYGLNHLDLSPCATADGTLWLEFIHQTIDVDGDWNSRDYGISRTGVLIGAEERCGDFIFGMLGGYAKPYLYSYGDKYDTGDLQFGFYGGTTFWDLLETKLHIGFGSQSYHSKRFLKSSLLNEDGSVQRIDGKFSGNSMSISLELAVPIELGMFGIRPLLALDSDLSWQYGYTETGDTGLELAFDRTFFDRTYLRTGFTTRWGAAGKCSPFSLVGRFYYGYQVGGDAAPSVRSRFVGDPTLRMEILGANPGKDQVNLGVGFRWNVDDCRGFYGDYDYNALNRSQGHYASLGFIQTW